ncbi:MAG: trypsin-like peptidase domain-containing protein [Candidatus Brocadia sp.]|jgi:Trypsin-like serine proteases, typically periplasmic, contain C-terminal PDZ domain|uniref:Protease n=1 Tax=Candidatus Brocadia fulgida TaxID=380242 RepID=A0A0M2UW62_9BACT|nr:MAG: protease [Candidatus Brocadia fulgida]UJS21040.1 MAG: trypsin-like peptidase domain-containing protein [Candidatus Brocadia sp.]
MKRLRGLIFWWTFLSILSLWYVHLVFAARSDDISRLKQELLDLEKVTNPLIQTFRKVSQLVSPSVVSLSTEKKASQNEKNVPEPQPPSQNFPPKHEPHADSLPKKGLGSGIIIDERGYILTNNHVITGFAEDEITVATHNGEQYNHVKIVGVDPNTDIAVIKIEGEDFTPITFGNSEEVQVGDWVIAIGSPFGYQQTVSAGIISAKGRTHVIPFELPFIYEDFFQTDAAINPGNSGGPLVNLRGEVIGVNTAIATRSGGFQGVGFAISAGIVKETVDNIMATGTVVRGYLGVGTHDINNELAQILGLKDKKEIARRFSLLSEKGAFVLEVWSDTPASKAGISPGDIICEIGGKKIENTIDLQHAIRRAKVNAVVIVKVVRNGAESALEVLVEPQPQDLGGKTYVAIRKLDEPTKFSLGLVVNDLNPEVAKSLGLEGEHGVLVVDVETNSPSERAGIQPGDLITKVGTKEVRSVLEFMTLMEAFIETNMPVSIFVKDKGFITLK